MEVAVTCCKDCSNIRLEILKSSCTLILKLSCFNAMSRGSVVGKAIVLQAGQSGVRFLADARHFCLLQNVQTGCGAHPAIYT